ncbi:MAG: hypothetical protein ABR898_01355 [Terracidiphilus sp.]
MGRKSRIADNAEGTTVYLTPDEQLVLRAILAKRKRRAHPRASLNEIMVDALWTLAGVEKITKEKLEAFLSEKGNDGSARPSLD